ncbi:hypothetical protein GJAV_G00052820 [Gymnothorax javanicus]|nr:hypothetical protein GJAV_G00052820 [Gymnothorax javanicus]
MNRKQTKRSQHGALLDAGSRNAVQQEMSYPSAQISQTTSPFHGLSLEELILGCLHSFDSEGKLSRGAQMVHMTLMMHSWVVSSHTFAHKLLSIYPLLTPFSSAPDMV